MRQVRYLWTVFITWLSIFQHFGVACFFANRWKCCVKSWQNPNVRRSTPWEWECHFFVGSAGLGEVPWRVGCHFSRQAQHFGSEWIEPSSSHACWILPWVTIAHSRSNSPTFDDESDILTAFLWKIASGEIMRFGRVHIWNQFPWKFRWN